MTALQTDSAALRHRVDSGFDAVQAQFLLTEEKLRREFQEGMHALEKSLSTQIETESQRLVDRISSETLALSARLDRQDARIDRPDAKIDQLIRWMVSAQLTTLALVVGIALQVFLR